MVERRDVLKLAGALAAASAAGVSSAMAQAPAINKTGTHPLKITKVQPFIIRYPKDNVAEPDIVHMAPIGATNEGTGLWRRLDFHSPCRFNKGYQQVILVKVTTNQGIVGWGEGHAVAAPRVHHAEIADLLGPLLIGQDARDIDVLWERMRTSQRLRGYSTGSFLESIAAIDIALWDAVGKYFNTPVYRLLGGKYRDEIPTYTWINGTSISSLKEQAAKAINDGYTVIKMSLSQDVQEHPGSFNFDQVIAVSETIKGKAQVIVDSLGTFKLYEATKIGRDLDRLGNIGWWEDPLMPEDDSGHVELARAIDTPICKGEGLHNRTQMRDLCAAKAMDISNLDVAKAGGISETKKMALIADLYGIMWSPHVSIGCVPYIAASIHLGVATPNCLILENQNQINGPLGNILLKEPIEYRPGYAKVPERPGLGIEFDEAQLAKVTIG